MAFLIQWLNFAREFQFRLSQAYREYWRNKLAGRKSTLRTVVRYISAIHTKQPPRIAKPHNIFKTHVHILILHFHAFLHPFQMLSGGSYTCYNDPQSPASSGPALPPVGSCQGCTEGGASHCEGDPLCSSCTVGVKTYCGQVSESVLPSSPSLPFLSMYEPEKHPTAVQL